MSDSDFVDVGDELVIRIGGYPVGKAKVIEVRSDSIRVQVHDMALFGVGWLQLPLSIKDYDQVDGVAHNEDLG